MINKLNLDKTLIQHGLNVLKEIRESIPDAVITGGYLRDSFNGIKPKDIDIFFPNMPKEEIDPIMTAMHYVEMYGATYMPQSEVTRIWDSPRWFGQPPIQLIMLAPGYKIEDRIQEYDFGFCQIWSDGEDVYCTDNFLKDQEDSTITLVYCEDHTQFRRSMRRFDRFRQKYPHRRLRIKDGLNFHEKEEGFLLT